ncbi:MAG: glutamine synthetase, partial [Spirochaetales bacterium]|nr:glutamine synthetase [Candidatus Physcosoma equi]
PDLDTLTLLPWRPENGKAVRMFCTLTYPDGREFENDSRTILKKAVAKAKAKGLSFFFGSEIEFYLFKLDEKGRPTKETVDEAGYMDVSPVDKGDGVRREVCLMLEDLSMKPEGAHHEEGPGQNEIDFTYSDPVSAADNAQTLCSVVKTIAERNGLFVDFSPKPLADKAGNGLHINMSVKGGRGDNLKYMIAGILKYIKEITLFLNPTEDSYRRLGAFKAPKYISWSVRTVPSSSVFLLQRGNMSERNYVALMPQPTHTLLLLFCLKPPSMALRTVWNFQRVQTSICSVLMRRRCPSSIAFLLLFLKQGK